LAEFHLNPKAKMFPLLEDLKRVSLGFPNRVSKVPNNKLRAPRPRTKLITKNTATPIAMRLVDTNYSSKIAFI
jgi:hypothetical protein